MPQQRIVLTGGGSGGHIFPLFAVAENLKRSNPQIDLRYLGPNDRFAGTLDALGIRRHSVAGGKLRRYASGILDNILDLPRFGWGLLQALAKLYWLMPDVVFSKGGTGALPVVLAAWVYHIPVVIHESDSTPGLTNLVSAKFAKKIAVSFESALSYFRAEKAVWTGHPIRKELLDQRPEQSLAKQLLNFDPKLPLLLILGGSQGSVRINEFIALNLPEILKLGQVLHQVGDTNQSHAEAMAKIELAGLTDTELIRTRYQITPFVLDMKQALSAADLVISRSSSTIFEIASFGKPMLLIPLEESANDHQRKNAFEIAKLGAAVTIEEPNLLPDIFMQQLKNILLAENLEKMRMASSNAFRPGGTEAITDLILAQANWT